MPMRGRSPTSKRTARTSWTYVDLGLPTTSTEKKIRIRSEHYYARKREEEKEEGKSGSASGSTG
jgi:hypothetical protein